MKKNNKGFTLIELLAVIVVLAIIMVIATTQINGVIRRNRADSFYDSALMIQRNAELACAQYNNELTKENVLSVSDLGEDIDIEVDDANNQITVNPVEGGEFDNVTFNEYYGTDSGKEKPDAGITVNANNIVISNPCDVTTTSE
jgi:type IV pilus assembly protein PilA